MDLIPYSDSTSSPFTDLRNDSVVVSRVHRVCYVSIADLLKVDGECVLTVVTCHAYTVYCNILLLTDVSWMTSRHCEHSSFHGEFFYHALYGCYMSSTLIRGSYVHCSSLNRC